MALNFRLCFMCVVLGIFFWDVTIGGDKSDSKKTPDPTKTPDPPMLNISATDYISRKEKLATIVPVENLPANWVEKLREYADEARKNPNDRQAISKIAIKAFKNGDVKALQRFHEKADVDKNGRVSYDEMLKFAGDRFGKFLNMTKVSRALKDADGNGDGDLTFKELKIAVERKLKGNVKQNKKSSKKSSKKRSRKGDSKKPL